MNIIYKKHIGNELEVFLHDPGDLGGRFLHFAHNEKQLLKESFKIASKKIGNEKIILDFFNVSRYFSSRHVLV